jgi:hypothetical protein
MVESGMDSQFWFKSALASETYKKYIRTTAWIRMHGERQDVSRFQAFGHRAWVHLNLERREKGNHMLRAFNAINLGFKPNTIVYLFFIPGKNTVLPSKQAKFDEGVSPFRKKKVIAQYRSNNLTDILYFDASKAVFGVKEQ